jgi:FtsZ-binding cell division protein ZapB
MDLVNNNENGNTPFSSWTVSKKDVWEQDELQSKVDEHNNLLNYCHDLENQITILTSEDSHLKYRQFEYQEEIIPLLVFLEKYRTLIFLVINILFIILISIFFYFHPEKEFYN